MAYRGRQSWSRRTKNGNENLPSARNRAHLDTASDQGLDQTSSQWRLCCNFLQHHLLLAQPHPLSPGYHPRPNSLFIPALQCLPQIPQVLARVVEVQHLRRFVPSGLHHIPDPWNNK